MYVLNDLGLILLFALSFVAIYFIYERIIAANNLSFIKTRQYVLDSTSGIIYGLATLLLFLLMRQIDSSFYLPIYLIVPLVILIIKNINSSVFTFIIPLIYQLVIKSDIDIVLMNITMFTGLSIIYLFVQFYIGTFLGKVALFIAAFLASFVAIIVIRYWFNYAVERYSLENSIFIPFSFGVLYIILKTSVNVSISANVLFESVTYHKKKYLRHSAVPVKLSEFLKANKIEKAFLGLFEITVDNLELNYEEKDEVIDTILQIFSDDVSEKGIIYNYEGNLYGFFIPIRNGTKETLKLINGHMAKLYKNYITESGSITRVTIKSGASIYGIDSNSLLELEQNSIFAMKTNDKNLIKRYSRNENLAYLKDSRNLKELDDAIDLNIFKNKYIPLAGKNNAVIVNVEGSEEYSHTESVDKLVRLNGWKNTFDRYFATEALKKDYDTMFIEYSPFTLTNFNFDNFKKRFSKIRRGKTVYWILSATDINSKVVKNINKHDLNIALKNVDNTNINLAKNLKHEFQIVSSVNSELTGAKVIPYKMNDNELKVLESKVKISLLGQI